MLIPKSGVRTLLVVLYIAAVWVRLDRAQESEYNYFTGESATNYRQASLVVENGRLPAVDTKMAGPEGFAASRERPTAIEHLTGWSFRAVRLVSDMPLKEYAGLLTVLLFSLTVFTFYALTFELWACQAGSLFAAFLVAFSGPVVDATTGLDFLHAPFAVLLVSLHLTLFLAYLKRPSSTAIVGAAVVGVALLAIWAHAGYYLAAFGAAAFIIGGSGDERGRQRLFALHLAAVVIAGLALPHLRSARWLLSWPALFFMVTTAYFAFRASLPRRVPGPVYIAGGVVVLSLLFAGVRSGGVHAASVPELWWYRLRFLAAKPGDPQLLSEAARFLWTREHTYAPAYAAFQLYFPLLFLAAPAVAGLRGMGGVTRRTLGVSLALAIVGTALFLLDRSAVLAAALGLFPLAGAGFHGLSANLKTRLAPAAVAAVLVVSQALAPYGKANATYRIGARLGMPVDAPDDFFWVSIGNADQQLVRYVVSRTSLRNVYLAPRRISPLLVAFAGRTTALSGGNGAANVRRTIDAAARLYGEERQLHALCDSLGVELVVYSIDGLLDGSTYSPRYLAGVRDVGEDAVVWDMHFAPERLDHFNLVYENDNYRLFRVTDEREPLFLTDHPIVYQKSILRGHNDTLDSFYDRIVDLLVTYQTAVEAQRRGNEQEAIRRFRYCLEQAPRFTRAWLGVGDSLLRLRDMGAANAAYMRVLQYAPDNASALYYTALTLGHLERREEAVGFLDVLIATGGDRELIALANELRAVLKSGIPLDGSSGKP